MMNGVDRVDALEDIFDGVVDGVFAGFDGESLVTHVLQRDNFLTHFFLRQLLAGDVLVLVVVRTVNAAVDAVVGEVKRREHNNTVAVEGELDFLRQIIHRLNLFRNLTRQKNGRFAVGQTFAVDTVFGLLRTRLFEDRVDEFDVVLVFFGVADGVEDFLVVDEFFRLERFGIVDCHGCVLSYGSE